MPTYEYECPKCPRTFEVRQRITEPPLETCDRCGGPVRRLISAAPFILKGEGWYVTDYPSEARKKGQSAESASSPKESAGSAASSAGPSSSKDGGSAESKPAASSDSKSSTASATGSSSTTSKPSDST